MLFLTYWYVLFAIVLFPIYWAVPSHRVRRLVLLAGSIVFHTHFAGPAGVIPIVIMGVCTYLVALTGLRSICRTMIVANVLALVYYKYALFLCNQVVGAIWPEAAAFGTTSPFLKQIVPPLAISFFVFEYVHYLLDIVGGSPPIRDPIDFALFSVFWPSIVAGPVKRYQEFIPELHRGLEEIQSSDVAEGILRAALGYAKKIIADNLTAYIAYSDSDARFEGMTLDWRWFVVLCIGLRILLDFSGYSDMAVGFARMYGIRLPENFNWPYLARSINEFWRRWHMSLSRWIRDYVYIPLGGNRRGAVRAALNGLITFALCGLWHGAGFNFLTWGVYHGVGLAIAGSYRRLGLIGRLSGKVFDYVSLLGWMFTVVFVFIGWLFFFYPMPAALHMMYFLLPEALR
jgi:alginate O-acetyltransferase complex protein AlgI